MERKSLHDNADFACPIVGTCLTVNELRKICRKCGNAETATATDYEAHIFLVGQAKEAGSPTAKYLQKFLDRKYRHELRAFFRIDDPGELRRLWRQRADTGNIPGAFWALMSHPTAPEALLREVYGEVHMLSHRVGAANRADLSRVAALEDRVTALATALGDGRSAMRRVVGVWKGRCRQAMEELAAERTRRQAAERERVSLRQAIASSAVAAVTRERDALHAQLGETTRRLADTETEAGRQALVLERLYTELEQARRDLADRDSEVTALEATLFSALGSAAAALQAHAEHHRPELADPAGHYPHDAPEGNTGANGCDGTCGRNCPCRQGAAGLAGKRVLYVGGRCSLVAHYKVLAAKFGCELLHHDGGREQSAHRLWELLGAVDAVVCPVDCVSHEACALVKQACRGCLKPLILTRSSGLSSLARSLTELGATPQ